MPNETSTTVFPATKQDISNLKQTACDAATDLSSSATDHVLKAKGQIENLAGHLREEGSEQVTQLKGNLTELANAARNYALDRPLTCLGVAFVGGFLLAKSFRGSRS